MAFSSSFHKILLAGVIFANIFIKFNHNVTKFDYRTLSRMYNTFLYIAVVKFEYIKTVVVKLIAINQNVN